VYWGEHHSVQDVLAVKPRALDKRFPRQPCKREDAIMKNPSRHIAVASFVAMLLLTSFLESKAQSKPEPSSKGLTLGVVLQGPHDAVKEHFSPFVNYVARKLMPAGNAKGMVVVAPTAGQMIKLLEEKQVDFYMESPYPTYIINRLGAARLLCRRWKGGIAEYRSLIFTNKESGIARLEDLRGKIIAFEDPGSTSGYFLPKLFLLKKGFSVVEKAGRETKVSASEIGYIFANTDKNMVNLVVQQKIAAGAFSSDDFAHVDDTNKASISILGETESMPRHLVSVRKGLPEPVVLRLKEVLLGMHQDKEGRNILEKADNTTKFDSLPGGEERVRRQLVELYRQRRH
jgi:phosphonate transport system substrate-binding protein